jgi:CDP-diacylglycerol--serine O-phosphatidyltransferase
MRVRFEQEEDPAVAEQWQELPGDRLEQAGRLGRLRRLGPACVWPTLFTLGNLIAGFSAIYCATRPMESVGFWGWSTLTMACGLVLLGIILDSVDGSVARLTGGVTEIGGQLDALADLITFGVAPAFIMLSLCSESINTESGLGILAPGSSSVLGRFCWAIAALFVCCAALRLARFTVETAGGRLGDHLTFRGMPSPGAAGTIASVVLLHQHLSKIQDTSSFAAGFMSVIVVVVPILTLLMALAMISAIPYRHATNRYLRVNRSFAYTAWLAVFVVLGIWWFQETLAIIFVLYALSGPVLYIWTRICAYPGTPVKA